MFSKNSRTAWSNVFFSFFFITTSGCSTEFGILFVCKPSAIHHTNQLVSKKKKKKASAVGGSNQRRSRDNKDDGHPLFFLAALLLSNGIEGDWR